MNLNEMLHAVSGAAKANSSIIFAVAIALIAMGVYWPDLSILANEALNSESVSHVLLVPFLTAYLLYQKRHLVRASISLKNPGPNRLVSIDEAIGLALCLSSFLLYWFGSYTFYPVEYHLASLPLLVFGMTLIVFNRRVLAFLFVPILFLLFLVPPPSVITYSAGALIANFNTQVSYAILQAARIPVVMSYAYGAPTIAVNLPNGQPLSFAVDLACSGIYSLTAFTMFAAFLSYVSKGTVLRKAVLFMLGFSMLVVLNIVRITSIVFIGYQFGEEIAMTLFHTASGWVLIFVGILILLVIGEKFLRLELFSNPSGTLGCEECSTGLDMDHAHDFCKNCGSFRNIGNPKQLKRTAIKISALTMLFFALTMSIQTPVLALARSPSIASPNWQIDEALPELPGYNLQSWGRDETYERLSQQDASLTFVYLPTNASEPAIYLLLGVADSLANLHNWEVCLVTWQTTQGKPPLVSVLNSKDVQILENPPIIARYFVFESPLNYTQATLYWYEKALFNMGTTVQQKYVRISLIILTTQQSGYQEFEERLLAVGPLIASYWEPLKTRSLISIGVPLAQLLLVSLGAFIIFAGMGEYLSAKQKKRRNLRIFENFATSAEKLVLQTIENLGTKGKKIEHEAIANSLINAKNVTLSRIEILQVLHNLENHGLIKKDIANMQNIPKLAWAT
jgi:exosortase